MYPVILFYSKFLPVYYIPKDIYLVQISVDGRLLNKKIVLQ